jgi:hypothetical protein
VFKVRPVAGHLLVLVPNERRSRPPDQEHYLVRPGQNLVVGSGSPFNRGNHSLKEYLASGTSSIDFA